MESERNVREERDKGETCEQTRFFPLYFQRNVKMDTEKVYCNVLIRKVNSKSLEIFVTSRGGKISIENLTRFEDLGIDFSTSLSLQQLSYAGSVLAWVPQLLAPVEFETLIGGTCGHGSQV